VTGNTGHPCLASFSAIVYSDSPVMMTPRTVSG
jgi:hypothetical protein